MVSDPTKVVLNAEHIQKLGDRLFESAQNVRDTLGGILKRPDFIPEEIFAKQLDTYSAAIQTGLYSLIGQLKEKAAEDNPTLTLHSLHFISSMAFSTAQDYLDTQPAPEIQTSPNSPVAHNMEFDLNRTENTMFTHIITPAFVEVAEAQANIPPRGREEPEG